MNSEMVECDHCGALFDIDSEGDVSVDGDFYCDECLEEQLALREAA